MSPPPSLCLPDCLLAAGSRQGEAVPGLSLHEALHPGQRLQAAHPARHLAGPPGEGSHLRKAALLATVQCNAVQCVCCSTTPACHQACAFTWRPRCPSIDISDASSRAACCAHAVQDSHGKIFKDEQLDPHYKAYAYKQSLEGLEDYFVWRECRRSACMRR